MIILKHVFPGAGWLLLLSGARRRNLLLKEVAGSQVLNFLTHGIMISQILRMVGLYIFTLAGGKRKTLLSLGPDWSLKPDWSDLHPYCTLCCGAQTSPPTAGAYAWLCPSKSPFLMSRKLISSFCCCVKALELNADRHVVLETSRSCGEPEITFLAYRSSSYSLLMS